MKYGERMQNVTVLGAAGKMGSGIVLLTAMELANLGLKPENEDKTFVLNAVDVSQKGLSGLLKYVRAQAKRAAEKKTVLLRELYEDRNDLVENEEIIDQYVEDVLNVIRPSTRIEAAFDSTLVFEAVLENIDLKVKLLSQIHRNAPEAWFFTNTSSIPIGELNEKANLEGRIIGFHFYNPPAVQKLVELISADKTIPELNEFARTYAGHLRKIIVPSNDFPGFIGNGHFMRDLLHGINEALRLTDQDYDFVEAVYMVNKVSQDYLIRPMGIFQLIDYVGLDVCAFILKIMNERIEGEDLHSDLLDSYLEKGVRGGQFSDGTQRNGFLQYERNRPVGVYDPGKETYVPLSDFVARCDTALGNPPDGLKPWKSLLRDPRKESVLKTVFGNLKNMDTLGADLARRYGKRSYEIGLKLVNDGVAANENDVNTVLLTGFYHLYGPINDYFNE